jgi:hypothetical protein
MKIVVANGFLTLVGQMDLSVPNAVEKNIGELLLEICINVVSAAIRSLLRPERFSIRPGLP